MNAKKMKRVIRMVVSMVPLSELMFAIAGSSVEECDGLKR
jgi:hypothetical protein